MLKFKFSNSHSEYLTEGDTSKWSIRDNGTLAFTACGKSESTSIEESVEFPWSGTVTFNEISESCLRRFVKTTSLFSRLGSWSVRRRTNSVFPKPPLFDETTRTQTLIRIKPMSCKDFQKNGRWLYFATKPSMIIQNCKRRNLLFWVQGSCWGPGNLATVYGSILWGRGEELFLQVALKFIWWWARWSCSTILIKGCHYIGTVLILATTDYHQAIVWKIVLGKNSCVIVRYLRYST